MSLRLEKRMGDTDSSKNLDENIEVPQHAKILIILSALIMVVGFVWLLILLATYTGVGIGLMI
jgi:hypothetical protein